jgi:hypothetical protein
MGAAPSALKKSVKGSPFIFKRWYDTTYADISVCVMRASQIDAMGVARR